MLAQRWLRLTPPEASKSLRTVSPERRMSPRWGVSGRITAVVREELADGPRNRILSLQLRDMSATGLGATIQDELAAGSRVTVLIPAHGAERGFDVSGRIIRCRPREEAGFDLGVRFAHRLAA